MIYLYSVCEFYFLMLSCVCMFVYVCVCVRPYEVRVLKLSSMTHTFDRSASANTPPDSRYRGISNLCSSFPRFMVQK